MPYGTITLFTPSKADAYSADTTIGALANAATEVVGNTTTTITHMGMRFDTSAIPVNAKIAGAVLVLQSSAVAGTPVDIELWASDFPSGVIRYNVPRRNHLYPIKAPICVAFDSADSATANVAIFIPSRFITKAGDTDFELRPLNPGTSGTNTRTIHSASASGGAGAEYSAVAIGDATYTAPTDAKPTLYVHYYTESVSGTATAGSATTLTDSGLSMATNEFAGGSLSIVYGTGTGQEATIVSNTATAFTVNPNWTTTPDTTSQYVARLNIVDPCSPGVGSEAYVAFEVESTCGTPVKAKYLLDTNSTDLDSAAENIPSRSLRRERSAPAKITYGRAGAGGSISFDWTPEKCTKLLLGWLRRVNTVDDSGNSNDGVVDIRTGAATNAVAPSVAPYWHTFKVGSSSQIKLFTFVQKTTDGSRFVYPGSMLDTLSISAGLDTLVEGAVSLMSNDEYTYDPNAGGGDDDLYLLDSASGYDSNAPLAFVGGEISFNNIVDKETIQNVSITLSNGVGETRGIRRNRGVKGHYPTKFTATVSFDMYFSNFDSLRKFLGVNHEDFPYKASRDLSFDRVDFKFAGPEGEDEQELVFSFPRLIYTVVRKGVAGEGPVMLSASASATLDSTSEGSLVVFVLDSQPKSFWSASTDEITVLPDEVKYT